jgi:arsenic resistance protein ArsH
MRHSPYYDRLVDVMEELLKFTYLTRGVSDYLTSRYSERKQDAEKLSEQAGLKAV